MAETLISPGVLARENDRSQVTAGPVTFGAAIIGPTVKGPVEIPTLVTSYSEYQNKFGTTFTSGSQIYTYFTSIAAYNYFNNGGTSLLVARVKSGSFTSATSTNIVNSNTSTPGAFATASVDAASFSAASFGGPANVFVITGSNSLVYTFFASPDASASPDIPLARLYYFTSGSGAVGPFISSSVQNLVTKMNEILSSEFTFATSSNGTPNFIISSSFSGSGVDGLNDSIFASGSFGSSLLTLATVGGGVAGDPATALTLKTISQGTIMNSDGPAGSNGTLLNGSSDNIRWQITNRNTSSGTFDLLIRQGNDSTTEQIVLETWTGLSMDPTAPNFVSRILGDTYFTYNSTENYIQQNGTYPNQSRYVYVSAVNSPTPNYFDNNGVAKSTLTSSIPLNAAGAFENATGTINGAGGFLYYQSISGSAIDGNKIQGIPSSSYNNMINLLANQDDYKFNILLTPGLFDQYQSSQVTSIISNTQNRGDNIYVLDLVGYGATVSTTTTEANSRNTSYAASYWPWVQTIDPDSGQNVWVPASTLIGGVYAFNDSVGEPWFAPAGINRGGLGNVIRAERKLSQANRDTLYSSKVNPIATFPGQGVVVYGQKTLQTKASALDRVNVRRLLIALKSYISQVALNLVFEQNTIATRNQFLSQVNPYLESVQQRQGLYAFKVVMDESNNTPDAIDRNQMIGAIYLQPTKTAEFIYLDFNITPTGATFPA